MSQTLSTTEPIGPSESIESPQEPGLAPGETNLVEDPSSARYRARSGRDPELYARAKRALEAPMMVLSLLLGGLIVAPMLWNLSPATEANLEAIGWVLWGLFVVEYALLFWLAPDRKAMVRSHLLELALILLPMLRPLRALRILRLARAFVGVAGALALARRVLVRRGLQWFLLSVGGVVVAGAGMTWAFEHNHPDSTIQSFGDALWWAVVTCTTVGYGDMAPVTPAGRGVAVVLMIVGVGLLSTLTANVASVFVQQDSDAALPSAEDDPCPHCNDGRHQLECRPGPSPIDAPDDADELRRELATVNAKLDRLMAAIGSTDTPELSRT